MLLSSSGTGAGDAFSFSGTGQENLLSSTGTGAEDAPQYTKNRGRRISSVL